MSRVTIGEITEDLLPFTEKGNKVIMVEIVPRKIVEDIIAECEKVRSKHKDCKALSYEDGLRDMAKAIKEIAESRLSEFEGVSE